MQVNNFCPDSITSQVEKGIRELENRKDETRTIKSGWNLQIQCQYEYQDMLPASACHSSFLLADGKG